MVVAGDDADASEGWWMRVRDRDHAVVQYRCAFDNKHGLGLGSARANFQTFSCEQSAEDTPRAYHYVNVIPGAVQLSGWSFTSQRSSAFCGVVSNSSCYATSDLFKHVAGRQTFPRGQNIFKLLIIRCSRSNPLVHNLTYSTA